MLAPTPNSLHGIACALGKERWSIGDVRPLLDPRVGGGVVVGMEGVVAHKPLRGDR